MYAIRSYYVPLRVNSDGSTVRVRDVGRTELGTERYGSNILFSGKPAAALVVRQAAGANASYNFV